MLKSHPTMGAWIEILLNLLIVEIEHCRTPRWVRGLKYKEGRDAELLTELSHPTMGAWIEISVI